jgi:hypothetical protein
MLASGLGEREQEEELVMRRGAIERVVHPVDDVDDPCPTVSV